MRILLALDDSKHSAAVRDALIAQAKTRTRKYTSACCRTFSNRSGAKVGEPKFARLRRCPSRTAGVGEGDAGAGGWNAFALLASR